MKWKVTLQFLVSLIIIGIAINFINTSVMSYYIYKASKGGDIDLLRPSIFIGMGQPDIMKLNTQIYYVNGKPGLDPAGMKELKKFDAFVQFIDKDGKEIESINKPPQIKDTYSSGEINPESIKGYNVFIKQTTNTGEKQIRYIIGVPNPRFTIMALIYSLFAYFTYWNEPKIVSMVLTVLTVLLLGYLFGRSLSKPVVKVINGITTLAGGDYGDTYPEAGLYKDVYKGLNNLAKNLQSSEVERKKVEKMREEWIMNISHDLKTPLSSVKGYAELLMEPSYDLSPDERKKYSEVILNKSSYMEVLLEDLKLTHKLKNDLIPINKTDGNIVETLRDVVIGILNDPRFEQHKISFEPDEERIILNFDQTLMQRALTNIIYNAIVHNPDDTMLWIKVYKKDKVYIGVEDNGRGIAVEDLGKLFERYYRGTNTEELVSGSGLGLAIAKQVIEAHGGKIELESELGEGTKVKVIF